MKSLRRGRWVHIACAATQLLPGNRPMTAETAELAIPAKRVSNVRILRIAETIAIPVGAAIAALKAGAPIYKGTLKDNQGNVVIDKEYDNYDPYLDGMNWLLEGVQGSIT